MGSTPTRAIMPSTIEEIRQRLLAPKQPERQGKFLPTGLTLLDHATGGGLPLGHFTTLTGGSSTGKTWLLLQMMTECAIRLPKHRIRYNRPERGDLMDLAYYFKPLANRIEKLASDTLEEFYADLADTAKTGKPFLYGIDSEDALRPENDDGGIAGKARVNSPMIRNAFNRLAKRDSVLVMIKQARQNLAFGSKFKPETRSGGTAIGYFASVELWFKIVGKIRKVAAKKKRVAGTLLQIHVQKNRVAGRDRAVTIPFFPDLGFDETGSMVRWMADENQWPCKVPKGKTLDEGVIDGLGMAGTWDQLAHRIEVEGKVDDLKREVTVAWNKIEEACRVKRKPRY